MGKGPKVNIFEQEAKLKKNNPPMNKYSSALPKNWKSSKDNF